jgi:hypothetical protein
MCHNRASFAIGDNELRTRERTKNLEHGTQERGASNPEQATTENKPKNSEPEQESTLATDN